MADLLFFLSRQAPVQMRLGAGQSSVELALLSRLGATSGAPNNQCLFLLGFHDYMMQGCPATNWSILNSALTSVHTVERCR